MPPSRADKPADLTVQIVPCRENSFTDIAASRGVWGLPSSPQDSRLFNFVNSAPVQVAAYCQLKLRPVAVSDVNDTANCEILLEQKSLMAGHDGTHATTPVS